ncbi:tyrosine-type recombinase/integrase [Sinorhizobium medicae]|nr:tyrosine-type recombinase/integrase [Sinorhizobium medicae]
MDYDTPVIRHRAQNGTHLQLERDRPAYRLPDGFQMLFYGNGRPITLINHYLANRAKAQIIDGIDWRQTQQSLADDGAQATTFFHSLGKTWDDLNFKIIVSYAAALQAGYSVWTQKKLAPNTVTRRIGTVLRIAKFARQNKYPMGELPSADIKPADILQLAAEQLQDLGHNPDFVAPSERAQPRINPILEAKVILDELGPDILSQESSPKNCRDRLLAETALYTGLRVDEVEHLTVHHILFLASDMEAKPHQREFQLYITHTKGSKPGYVIFPKRIIEALVKYIETERALVVETAKTRLGEDYRDPGALFLNGIHANGRDLGRAMTAAMISRVFSRAVARCGLFVEEERFRLAPNGELVFDGKTGQPMTEAVRRPAHTYHDLRHTFAVVQYSIRSLRGDKNPLATVKTLLRHKLSQTTADIYLSWLHVFERQLSEMLSDLFHDLDAASEGRR